ncbi:YhgE/Pip domain-containing protein [Streptomyces griseocarneus]|uniref:YhgE/Pip domain-containing protein n=1 Tax=Streptomyces griseocarneus TaxID=51201 RepID=UPI00167DD2CB|nr:YhgE/Pip family protein [Streptomyces griseocarneus]MBZ6475488.1 SNG1 family protein [Streptomyces griseocarneus]GHG75572.1 membrane protein [Streptomyces griseocarneus]
MPSPQPPSALRSPRLWIGSGLILAVVSTLFALLYVGGNVNPKGNLRDLPVALVNSDRGADTGGKHVNLGDQVVSGIKKNAANNHSIDWQVLSRKEADKRLGQGKVFGALVVPKDFTAAVSGLTSPQQKQAARPTLTVLTNQSAGSIGSSMASQATQKAAHAASAQIGKELLSRANKQGARLAPAAQLMLADPAAVEIADGHPVGSHSAMGLSAFYYALVLVVCGMLGANAISSQVDTALGYVHTDFGPFRQRMPVQHTSRVRTLAIGTVLMLGLSVVMGSLVQVATVGILDMDASHLGLLWVYSVATIAVVGVSALALLAAFGTPGMLLSAIIFVAMAVPSSGATVPLQALPDFFRALGEFEPLRQITGGLRSILYYDAQADAGLARAWVSMGIALAVSVVFGFGVTRLYDRKGLHRIPRPTDTDESADSDESDKAAESAPAPASA